MRKESIKKVTNNRVYNLLQDYQLFKKHGICPRCPKHSGCNYWNRSKPHKNWKSYRNYQYYEKAK